MTIRKYSILIYIFFFIFISKELFSQEFQFERLTVENGLQNNIVFSVAQDSKGMMWFATSTGIDRYDGNKIVHYPLPLKDSTYSNYAQINYIFSDADGGIWAASSSAIYQYNQRKDRFVLPFLLNKELELGRQITSFSKGNNSLSIVIGCNKGFFTYQYKTGKIARYNDDSLFVRNIFQDTKSVYWVASNRGIKRAHLKDDTFIFLPDEISFLKDIGLASINLISEDFNGNYWLATAKKGLYVYNNLTKNLTKITLPKPFTGEYLIKDFLHDRKRNKTYISLDGAGVVGVDTLLNIIEVYQNNEDENSTLSNNAAYDIFTDSFNRFWITTYGGGVNVATPKIQPFVNFQHKAYNSNSLSNNASKAVTQDQDGNFWFGTRRGISHYNVKTNSWKHYNESIRLNNYSSDNILAIICDKKNQIWAGSYGGGVIRIDAKTGYVENFRSLEEDTNTIGTDYIYAILEDSKKRIWTGGIKGSVTYFNPSNKKFVRLQTPFSSLNCFREDSKGRILMGTEKGVYMFSNDILKRFHPIHTKEKITSILEYKPGEYWLGTLGGGVVVLNESRGVIKTLKQKDGMPSDVIACMEKESNGDVWIGTSNSIAHIQPNSNLIITYSKSDGLSGSQINYGSSYTTKKGEIIFGTTDGFSMFNPENIKAKAYKPNIVFTGLIINNREIHVDDQDGPLTAQIDEISNLNLKYNQNSLKIDFVNTSPEISGKHLYSWRLKGFDNEWSLPSIIPSANITNLNSGDYILEVKSFSKSQLQEPGIRSLNIIIQAPWWKTYWAYTGYLSIIAGFAFFAYDYIRNRNEWKRYSERLRLNTSISHEIRTPLTLVKGPVSALLKNPNLDSEDRGNINLAMRNIDKLENIISQFIDFQKMGLKRVQMQVVEANIIDLIEEVTHSFLPLMKAKNIKYNYINSFNSIIILYDKDKIEKILNNLFSNAIKYTPEKKDITLSITKDSRYLHIDIIDSGIGIPSSQHHLLFKGYFRADNTINLKETGSGIGLSVMKDLVEMHYGKINFKSEEGIGSTFSIKIPLVNENLRQFLVDDFRLSKGSLHSDNKTPDCLPKPGKTILVVEDNDELRIYLKQSFKKVGYEVAEAEDGEKALQSLERTKPDIIISDIMMPSLNGFQLCHHIKNNFNTSHLPIILLTAIQDKDYLIEAYKCGADDYVKKPFEITFLIARVENLLENRLKFKNKILSVFDQNSAVIDSDVEVNWLKRVTEYIVDRIDDVDFSVDQLSNAMLMSRSSLFRKFKSITGESPQQFIMQTRLRKAAELLHKRQNNINQIAYMCGFSDPKYFSTAFKKFFGITPTDFLKK